MPSLGAVMQDEIIRLRKENARLRKHHEALLNTLAPSKSPWVQKVWRNAKAAYTGIGQRGGPAEWGE